MGKLYVVGTPIGNLKDITFRAIEVLQSVNFIACEDTRRTSILLNHYKIEGKKLLSYYEPKESVQVPKIIKLLEKEDVALVTDAGTPSISDPGYKL
jgi:16S rRNA (cytidine1402-2'-O)-methyltransferase